MVFSYQLSAVRRNLSEGMNNMDGLVNFLFEL